MTVLYDSEDNVCTVKLVDQYSEEYTKEELIKILYSFVNILENLQ